MSLPARGVWIEIIDRTSSITPTLSLPARGVWIEIRHDPDPERLQGSLPARGVWIEIFRAVASRVALVVTPREGSVD